jgi:DNA-binding transcriptional ArsR family regulator
MAWARSSWLCIVVVMGTQVDYILTLINLVPECTSMKKDQKENKQITFEDSFLTSRRAVEVLTILSQSEDGNNASQIAREHDLDRSTVSRILKKLEVRNLIKISKRSQAKYFKPDYEKIADQAFNLVNIDESSFEDRDNYYASIEIMAEYYEEKFEALSNREDRRRYSTLRDILLIAPAIELPNYLERKGVSNDIDAGLVIGFREELNIGLNSISNLS